MLKRVEWILLILCYKKCKVEISTVYTNMNNSLIVIYMMSFIATLILSEDDFL